MKRINLFLVALFCAFAVNASSEGRKVENFNFGWKFILQDVKGDVSKAFAVRKAQDDGIDRRVKVKNQESNKKGNGKEIAVLGIAEAMLFHEGRVHEISSLLRRRFIGNAGLEKQRINKTRGGKESRS